MIKRLFLLCIVLVLDITAIAAAEPIKIGALLHVTGEFAPEGNAFLKGAELAIDQLNAAGLKFRLVLEDTQYRSSLTNSGARKLLDVDQVAAIIITTLHEAKTAASVLKDASVPLVVLWDSSPEMSTLGRHVFGIGPWVPSSGEVSAAYAFNSLKAKRAVVINTNTEWSLTVSNYFSSAFSALGGEIVQSISVNPDDPDFRAVILKIRAAQPEAIYAPVDANLIAFFRQLREAGVKAPVLTSDIISSATINEGGIYLEGVYQTEAAAPDLPEAMKLFAAYQKKYGHPVEFAQYTAWGYDGVMLIAEAIKRAGTDPHRVTEALYQIKDIKGASGPITIDTTGSRRVLVTVFQVQKGTLVRVNPNIP